MSWASSSGPLLTLAPDQLQHRGVYRSIVDAAVVGIAAFLVTAPIVAHHFGIVAPVSILAGLPAVPMMSLALIGALASLLIEPVVAPLARLFADGAALALDLLDVIATAAAALPYGNAAVPPPPWWSWSIAGAVACGAWRYAASGGRRFRWIAGIGSALAILTVWPLAERAAIDGLEIHFIDVGQGDAVAIRTPAARWVLVDTGPASAEYDAGERRVLPFLRDHGARRVEALVLTHPDLDHIGGAAAVLRGIPVRHVFEPGLPVGKDVYLDLLRGIDLEGTQWRAARSGRTMELDGVRFDFLWPDPETVDATEDANQISAVLRVAFGEFTLLLTGDAGVAVEDLLVDRHGGSLAADLLKLGHHGSSTSTSDRFLRATDPELAIVSAGRRNRYGHPAPAVMARVLKEGIAVARTDSEGSVSIEVEPADGHGSDESGKMMEAFRAAVLGEKLTAADALHGEEVPRSLVLRRGRLVPMIGGLLSGMNRSAAAVTLRKTIIVAPDVELTPGLLAHELAHVRQWEADWLFPLRYSLATLRHGYRNNPYEVEAREVEASVSRTQSGEDTT